MTRRRTLVLMGLLVLGTALACRAETTLQLTSPAFAPGARIPVRHTCDGADLSPPLRWSAPPPGTREMALICSDPDAPGGTFVHWLALGIPPGTRSLPEGASGLRLGTNDFGRQAYNGPCPPAGKPHRYVFEVLALDTRLDLPAGFTREQLEKAASGHVLARGRLTGLYGRK